MSENGGVTGTSPKVLKPQSIERHGFRVTTQSLPISKAGPIEEMSEKLKITPPEMIFGDNFVAVEHIESGWSINFNSFDALNRVDKTGRAMLQVAHSKEWQQSREHHHKGIKEVIKPFDWSYTTDYKGSASVQPALEQSNVQIPLELLRRPDPILFFGDVMLYEDELADNGITIMSCKIRVMPQRMLLLCRFFLRLDDVIFRIRDTRLFVEFTTGEVIREYTAREDQFETVRQKLALSRDDVPALMRDPNKLVDLLPVVSKVVDREQL